MIARTNILNSLKTLNRLYSKATTGKVSIFYSKLAVLELCGWIEEAMDDVVLRCARRHLKDGANLKFVQEEIVKKTYGFDYQKHFRRMLIQLLGVINVERLEKSVDQNKRFNLEATLNALKTVRNADAHTHVKGVTLHVDAPSKTLSQFPALYDGLVEFDATLKRTKF